MSQIAASPPVSTRVTAARYGVVVFAWLFIAGGIVQLFLAGMSSFDSPIYWSDHVMLGRMIGIPALLLPALAAVGRLGRRVIGLALGVTILYIVQSGLANMNIPALAALHAVNAIPLLALPGAVSARTRAVIRTPTTEAARESPDAAGGTLGHEA